MEIQQSTASQSKTSKIVERLFGRFSASYGRKFADLWGGADLVAVKNRWADAIQTYSMAEITAGVTACDKREWPPTLPEFLLLCRPEIKAESAYHEAVEQMQRRSTHTDKWSHPAIYWAAATIGTHDLHYGSWTTLGARWTKIFTGLLLAGEWQEIPPRIVALPPPIKSRSDENTAKFQAQVSSVLNSKRDHKKWAKDHKANYMAGKPSLFCQYNIPAEALGETVEQWAAERSAK